ncbi:MAG: STAS domain-containing protein [Planctomycetes bacterium]|nr:STAS domain-containing protein [Planctomycetota bacterium]
MKLTRRSVGSVVVVRVEEANAIDNLNREQFFDTMQLLINENPRVLVDLSKVDHMTSAAIGTLVALFRDASESGGTLKLVNLQEKLAALFEMTHLDTLFEIFDSEQAALQSFSKS